MKAQQYFLIATAILNFSCFAQPAKNGNGVNAIYRSHATSIEEEKNFVDVSVNNLINNPKNYIGKFVRINGYLNLNSLSGNLILSEKDSTGCWFNRTLEIYISQDEDSLKKEKLHDLPVVIIAKFEKASENSEIYILNKLLYVATN